MQYVYPSIKNARVSIHMQDRRLNLYSPLFLNMSNVV